MQTFEIRVLGKEDAPSVTQLWKALLIPSWTKKMIEEGFSLSTTIAYGIFSQGPYNLLGFIVGSLVQEEAEIYGIAVQEPYQGKKIGATLLKKFEQECFLRKGKAIFLEAAASNKKAQSFYLSQGYTLISKRANYYPNKEEAWVFCKRENTA